MRGFSHVENTDASVLGGERGGQRLHLVFPAICHYKGNKSPPSSDCYHRAMEIESCIRQKTLAVYYRVLEGA